MREVDEAEDKIIRQRKIQKLEGVSKVIDFIKKTDAPIHISFDVSVIDPEILNSTGNWVDGGMKPEHIKAIIETALVEERLMALDILEFNPKIGNDLKSLKAIRDIFGDPIDDLADFETDLYGV